MKKTFLGFGFGAIQAGLFLQEASASGNFSRLVVAEVAPELVEAVRSAGGVFYVNVALRDRVETRKISGVEIFNPRVPSDRAALIHAAAEADEMATALPSVAFYGSGEPGSVVDILAQGLKLKQGNRAILYAAENHNHAAEILEDALKTRAGADAVAMHERLACLNTVIGKMSGVVSDERQIQEQGLARMTASSGRAFLVEAFCNILISRLPWPDFERGIKVFEEKNDLLPFEEAKLYGHNAVHALLGYLARLRGCSFMDEIRNHPDLLALGRAAFLAESGAALCRKHKGVDVLFTEAGFTAYAEDLLERMLNPNLRDAVERVVRDPRRKLAWHDRLVGTMRLALSQGITPNRFALGAAAAFSMLPESAQGTQGLRRLAPWEDALPDAEEAKAITDLITKAQRQLDLVPRSTLKCSS